MTRQPVIRYTKRSRQYHCSNKGHIIHSIAVIIDYGRSSTSIVADAAAAAAAVYIVIC
jgi:phosphosulfolactate phosphohydrolase-like enzyme